MGTQITTEDRRTAKALAALERSGSWAKVRDTSGRPVAYGVPSASTPGVYHLANSTQCTCADSARFGNYCWHSRAVALHVAAVRAAQRPVLQMVRHPDGDGVTWERARRYSEIFEGHAA